MKDKLSKAAVFAMFLTTVFISFAYAQKKLSYQQPTILTDEEKAKIKIYSFENIEQEVKDFYVWLNENISEDKITIRKSYYHKQGGSLVFAGIPHLKEFPNKKEYFTAIEDIIGSYDFDILIFEAQEGDIKRYKLLFEKTLVYNENGTVNNVYMEKEYPDLWYKTEFYKVMNETLIKEHNRKKRIEIVSGDMAYDKVMHEFTKKQDRTNEDYVFVILGKIEGKKEFKTARLEVIKDEGKANPNLRKTLKKMTFKKYQQLKTTRTYRKGQFMLEIIHIRDIELANIIKQKVIIEGRKVLLIYGGAHLYTLKPLLETWFDEDKSFVPS